MAFDGIAVANLVRDFKQKLEGGRISRIAQPEKDELIITIKNGRENLRLLLSANPSLPLVYLTDANRPGPLTAPNFCMLLRKHIGSGRILRVTQPGLERVIRFEIEHLDELGDVSRKILIAEFMGRYSNLIFCREDGTILDSIRHVSSQMSSVREVLPGRPYFLPQTIEKADPLSVTMPEFSGALSGAPMPLQKALYSKFTGISPTIASELCHLASLEPGRSANGLTGAERTHLFHMLSLLMEDVREGNFAPVIIYKNGEPVEFSALPLSCLQGGDYESRPFSDISRLLETYYREKEAHARIRQKSAELRRVVTTALERDYRKYDLQLRQLKDTEKRDKYRVYGELLNTYGYELAGGEKEFTCLNFYTGQEIKIPLDPTLDARENAQRHFSRYNKLKRTSEAMLVQTAETKAAIDHLESISTALDLAVREEDLAPIREELMEYGFIKKRPRGARKPKLTSRPWHYRSADGFDFYVGKNNYQNEEVTFRIADGADWWFHAKGIPGSHVIVKTGGRELSDRHFETAASLAAWYSKGRESEKVEVDYVQRRYVKKAPGTAPGFVIYHTNYSMMAVPGIDPALTEET